MYKTCLVLLAFGGMLGLIVGAIINNQPAMSDKPRYPTNKRKNLRIVQVLLKLNVFFNVKKSAHRGSKSISLSEQHHADRLLKTTKSWKQQQDHCRPPFQPQS